MRLSAILTFLASGALAVAASAQPPAAVGPPPAPVGAPPSAVSIPGGVGAPPALAPTAVGSNTAATVSPSRVVIGMDLEDGSGASLGQVSDVIRGPGNQILGIIILTPDGISHVVPPSRISVQGGVLVTGLSEDQVQSFPQPQ